MLQKKNVKQSDLDWARNRMDRVLEAVSVNIILTDKGLTPKYLSEMTTTDDLVLYVQTVRQVNMLPAAQRAILFK